MGKATIIEALGEGEYFVRVDAGKAAQDAEVARLQEQVEALEAQIAGWQATLDAFEEYEEAPARNAVEAAQQAYIDGMKADPPPDAATVRALIEAHSAGLKALFEVRGRAALLRIQMDTWRLELAQARKDLARWESLRVEFEITAWCADATDAASGDVGTLEVPGEFDATATTLVIAPQEVPPTLPAGQIVAREVQSGAQAFFNAAILPGWQRHMPTYRAGRIRNIDTAADTCRVELDAARSSAQNLQINQGGTLYDVPVRYMTCNAAAFEDGDHVVVEFQQQDWTQPVVIGFVERPKPCKLLAIAVVSSQIGPRGSPADAEDDEALLPYRVRWAQYDPASGEIKNAAVRDISYAFSTWMTGPPSSCGGSLAIAGGWMACMTQQFYDSPAVFGGKSWMRRTSSMSGEPAAAMLAQDGGTLLFPRPIYSPTSNGGLVVAADAGDSQTLIVFDPATGAVLHEWVSPGNFLYDLAAFGNVVAMRSESAADDWSARVRVINVATGEVMAEPMFNPIAFVVDDIAVSATHFAVLGINVTAGEDWRILLYRIGAEGPVDDIPASGARAITMNDRFVVGCLASGVIGAQQGTPGGGVDVYRILEAGLSYERTDHPFPAEGDRAFPYAG